VRTSRCTQNSYAVQFPEPAAIRFGVSEVPTWPDGE
jgi:hypothetical protein